MDSNHAQTTKQCEDATRTFGLMKEKKESLPFASIELLKRRGNKMKRFSTETTNELSSHVPGNTSGQVLSTKDIIKLAREKYLQYISQTPDELSMLFHSFNTGQSGISCAAAEDVELVLFLLASADKVVHQQFYHANNLLSMCYQSASLNDNPVKRVVFYFAEALQERIHQEIGNLLLEGIEYNKRAPMQLQEALTRLHPSVIACQQQLPFCQVTQFTGIQVILENVTSARRVHVIDLGARSGLHWIILMQALAARQECPLELLKITAVLTSSKEGIEETGKRLSSFAEGMNMPLSFQIVVSDMEDLKEEVFSLEAGEAVAVYSQLFLSTMLAWPSRLEALMGVIKNICPRVMVVTEIEAHTNRPSYVDRLIEALLLYGSLFDCLEACMDRCNQFRITTESVYLWEGIQNIVTSDGEEWTHRHEKIDFWRAFFARFGIVETELSMSSLYQADLVVKKFPCGNSCTLDMNGKCLVLGWKGTPINSLSAWKFPPLRGFLSQYEAS